jgi:hypothetical protein
MRVATWLCVAGFFLSFAGTPPAPVPCGASLWYNWLHDGGLLLAMVFLTTPLAGWTAYGLGAHGIARALMFAPALALVLYLAAIAYVYVTAGTTLFCYLGLSA